MMELGVHLPLMEFGNEGLSLRRLQAVVDAARESAFVAVSANDHFVFSTPWLDGPTALGGDRALGRDDACDDDLAGIAPRAGAAGQDAGRA
jgi:hypothetical protein